jgi:hypothetical protein
MRVVHMNRHVVTALIVASSVLIGGITSAYARDVEYQTGQGDIEVFVNPAEPTDIEFPGKIKEGFKSSTAGISVERKVNSLVVFGKENINDNGEAILVKLEDGRSYPVRIRRATADNPRDATVSIGDGKGPIGEDEEEMPIYKERGFDKAPPSKVSGLMREMVLVAEFGKRSIAGYQVSEKYKGQTVVNDGAVLAKIDRIFIGPNLWGYVLDTTNLLDQSQKLNPASFRIDGTRAVSASNWELTARPMNVEEQVSGKHNTKVYIVARAR